MQGKIKKKDVKKTGFYKERGSEVTLKIRKKLTGLENKLTWNNLLVEKKKKEVEEDRREKKNSRKSNKTDERRMQKN